MQQGQMAPHRELDDEIDLFELAQSLWQEKVTILVIGFVTTLLAVVYALLATPVFQAKTVVAPPLSFQVQGWNEGRKAAGLSELSPKDIYAEFLRELKSRTLSKQFFEEVYLVDREAQGLPVTPKDGLRNAFSKVIAVKQVDAKQNPDIYEVSVQLSDPEKAADWAQLYVDYAFKAATTTLQANIATDKKLRMQALETEITQIKIESDFQRKDEIERLREALAIANRLGLAKPTQPGGQAWQESHLQARGVFLYLLGSDTLQAQLDALTQRQNKDAFVEGLRELESKQALLTQMEVASELIDVMRVDQLAEVPASRVKPKRSLIVAVGFVLGGMLGVFAALLRSAIRKRKASIA